MIRAATHRMFGQFLPLLAFCHAVSFIAAQGQGVFDPVLDGYVENGTLWSSRGAWYNIEAWAARTSNCAGNATSVACMACSMERPGYAVAKGVAPIAVANELWFAPERGAVCGMCLKIFMPNGTLTPPDCPDPSNSDLYPGCTGRGTEPYLTSVSNPLNYGASVAYDETEQQYYFTAIVIEWFDRNQTDKYALSYPTQQTDGVDQFGTWPIKYQGVSCPVGTDNLLYNFLNAAAPVPFITQTNQTAWLQSGSSPGLPQDIGSTLCNNLAGQPCGDITKLTQNPLGFLKLQITGQRIPLSGVEVKLQDDNWYKLKRSGDNYWEPSSNLSFELNASTPIDVKVYCADGSDPIIDPGLVPADMLCDYQDPKCQPHMGTVQC